ncbi:MAG: MBL fold metallo-hydrolase, partial [Roseobacter sp.]
MKILTVATATLIAISTVAAAQDAKRSLTQVAGDVYRWQNNNHFGLVVFTDDGVVVADPINAEASSWLEGEISARTELPVTHLVYSHSHADHASGGEVFADTAQVVAHERAPDEIVGVAVDRRVRDVDSMEVGNKTLEFNYLGKGHGTDLMAVIVRPENVAFIVDAMAPRRLPFRDMPGANIDDWTDQVRK